MESSYPGGDNIPFKRDKGLTVGVPYIDLREHKQGLVLIETARKNFTGFTPQEIEKGKLSRQTQERVGHPPAGIIKKNPVSLDDVANSLAIFGANVNRLKGAATKKKPHIIVGGRCEILSNFYQLNKFVTLTADVFRSGQFDT